MGNLLLMLCIFGAVLFTITNTTKAYYKETISFINFIIQAACITYIIYWILERSVL